MKACRYTRGCCSPFAKGFSDTLCCELSPPLQPPCPAHMCTHLAELSWLYHVCQKRRTQWHLALPVSPCCPTASLTQPGSLTSPGLGASACKLGLPSPRWAHTFAPRCLLEAQLVGKSSATPGISSPLSESAAGRTRLLECVSEATP